MYKKMIPIFIAVVIIILILNFSLFRLTKIS